ncbi:MAG: 4'-phosphopantetheinyl transferase family protein [Oscillospiraceae bacterium]|jgi:phosphopantetheinyl transferase
MTCHIFFTDIRLLADRFEQGCALLPATRQKRISRCKPETARLQLLTAGLLLRKVLSITTDTQLLYTPSGKPYLQQGPCFNLSHSGNLAALAVDNAPIGLDLQEMTKTFYSGVASRYFKAEEIAWMQDLPDRFFWLWTRKESVIKSLGLGLSSLLTASFSVLEDNIAMNGTPLYLSSQILDRTTLSLASQSPLFSSPRLISLSAEQLLDSAPI